MPDLHPTEASGALTLRRGERFKRGSVDARPVEALARATHNVKILAVDPRADFDELVARVFAHHPEHWRGEGLGSRRVDARTRRDQVLR